MTIGDMRRLMLKKVVPESVVPQNIVDFLIDENAQLPEPDAFTFLNRLRGLGIGSADFLYLLEGCGAPEAAVEKIRANPAMNLQGLILTLEGSGMTSKDYTRILYTARQIWERTLTLRLQTSEALSADSEEGGADTDDNEYEEQSAPVSENTAEVSASGEAVSAAEPAPAEAPEPVPSPVPAPDADISAGADKTAADEYAGDNAPLPHVKPRVVYPDATEELMSVDFNADRDYPEDTESTAEFTAFKSSASGTSGASRNPGSAVGIGSSGGTDLFGDNAVSGELDYSQSFTESFVSEYMVDFAEDDLTDLSDDEDFSDDFGGTYYGDFEDYTDEIPEVSDSLGNSESTDPPKGGSAYVKPAPEAAGSGIPDAREPFEVHIASYDIPEEPDEFERARAAAESTARYEADDSREFDIVSDKTGTLESGNNTSDGIIDTSDGFVFPTEEDLPKKHTAPFEVKIDYGDDEPESTSAPEAPSQPYNGETTMLIPISREQIEQNISTMADDFGDTAGASSVQANDHVKTAVQKSSAKTARQQPGSVESGGRLTDISRNLGKSDKSKTARQIDDDYDDDFDDLDDEKKKSGFKKGAVIAAGVGAAVLVGANFAVAKYISDHDNSKIVYAESADQVFSEIYHSYVEEKISGGGTVSGYQTDYSKVFGDLLICGKGLGTFAAGDFVYNVSDTRITASTFKNGELTAFGQIEVSDANANGAKFVAAFENGDSLIAVYSGDSTPNSANECGYLRIKGGETVYTVRQSGKLTDLEVKDGEIRLGSVYTPVFYESFNAERTDVYLPKVGTGSEVIEPRNIVLSRTKGYTYALSAGYVFESGAVSVAKAALGDPVYASADGRFVMNGSETKKDSVEEYGLIISAKGEEPVFERCGKVSCAAAFENGSAVFEGGATVIRDNEFKIVSKIGSTAKLPTKLRFSGNTLIASDDAGILLTVDCTDMASGGAMKTLKQINGSCDGSSAITLEADANGIKLTRYVLENGAAKEIVSFTRELTSAQIQTLVCGSANAMVVTDGRCGAAYSYFDGVSVISEYVTLSDASEAATLFDDKTGFEYAFVADGKIYAVCSKGAVDVAAVKSGQDEPEETGSELGENPENPPPAAE